MLGKGTLNYVKIASFYFITL